MGSFSEEILDKEGRVEISSRIWIFLTKPRPRVKTRGIGLFGYEAFISVINHGAFCGAG